MVCHAASDHYVVRAGLRNMLVTLKNSLKEVIMPSRSYSLEGRISVHNLIGKLVNLIISRYVCCRCD